MKRPIPFGKYLLLDRINVGGMAEVFLAKSFGVEGFERILAIKKILPTMVEDEEFITMFIDEARISVQLNHANIVQIYELGRHDENYFIAMEYVSGRDLRTLLDRFKRQGQTMPTGQAVYIAQKVCEGLDYAHRKRDARGQELGIIHRDVSPQNVLLSFEGEVKLIDFGIAKAANRAQKTQAGILKGKFGYMSPEQVRGLPIDRRSDIFAVGVCLYEMLTGEKLFVGESDFSTLEKVRNAEVIPPRELNADIPEGLEAVMMKALARDVEERYQWASDMQEDLMRFLLSDGILFSAKHLGKFMNESFGEALEAEGARMEQYAQVTAPPEVHTTGVTHSAPGVTLRPEAHFGEPPPEMLQAAKEDATQLFDASAEFDVTAHAKAPPEADVPAAESTVISDIGQVEEEPAGVAAGLGEAVAGPELDDAPTRVGDPVPAVVDEHEVTATPVGVSPLRSGPLGDPDAAGHRAAVGEFAAEIPSLPGVAPPGEGEALLDEATRITSIGDVKGVPPPAAAPPVLARSGPPSPRPPSPPVMRASKPAGDKAGSSSSRKAMIFGGGGLVAVAAAALVYIFVIGKEPAAPEPATLIIITQPDSGLEIFVDERLVATESPHVLQNVPAGTYTVAIRRPGTRERQDESVVLEAGQATEVRLSLVDAPARDPEPAVAEAGAGDGDAADADAAGPEAEGESDEGDEAVAAAETEAEEAPAAEESGADLSLGKAIVRSHPRGAEVSRDGKVLGTTPFTIEGLARDEVHTFIVSLAGHRVKELVIEFAGAEDRDVTVRLEQLDLRSDTHRQLEEARAQIEQQTRDGTLGQTPAPAPRKTAQRPQQQRRPQQRRRPPQQQAAAQPQGRGTLVAMTSPVAQVFVNGRDTGRWTPLPPGDPLELPAGNHTIEFRADDGRTKTMRVTIEADQQARLVGITF
jgi:eukaryotic-like serine/threonine-protein kinase